MANTDYDDFMKIPINELVRHAADGGAGSRIEITKLVYHQRMLEKQHDYAKKQIELQHEKNSELLRKQLRWVKISAVLNILAILGAVLLGWFLAELKIRPTTTSNTQQTIQSQVEQDAMYHMNNRLLTTTDKVP